MNDSCLKDGHARCWHTDVGDPEHVLICRHPAHGLEQPFCGPEAACFPEIAQMRARVTMSPLAGSAGAST